MPQQKSRSKRILILTIFLCLGFVGLWVFFSGEDVPEDPTQRYRITTAVDAAAIDRMFEVMRVEPEFAFYFAVLDPAAQRLLREEAASVILQNNSAAGLLAQIKHAYARTQNLGATFYFMEYDDGFSVAPERYPQLLSLYEDFIKEEFKLTVLGVYYKAHFDAQFVFAWDELTILAAQKLRQIHNDMLTHRSKI